MITLCIRYTIDPHKLRDFEQYAHRWPEPIRRCGGNLRGYFLPTKLAGPTNFALALIDFADLAAYERYREALTKDRDAIANVACAEDARCILIEDRCFLQPVT
jgi:hypothetical protein